MTALKPSQTNHFALLPTGAGEARDLSVAMVDNLRDVSLRADGQLILIGSEHGHGVRCYSRSIEGGPLRALTPEGNDLCSCSPDFRYAVASDNVHSLSVYDLHGGGARALPGTDALLPIRWLDNHSILAYRNGELPGRVFQIDVVTGKQRLVKEFVPGDRAGVTQLQNVAASPDGRTLAYSYQQVLYDLYVVEGLK
jgi:hypothetical protein